MKKALVILLTLAMILGMTAVPVVAAEEETETFIPAKEINDFGQVPADYKPEGTAIKTAEEFAAMDPAGTYYLANDITISETFPVPFSGTFDGNGKAITTSVPLFNVVDGTVKNLTTKGKLVVTEKPQTAQAMAHAGVIAVAASEGGDSYFTNICNMANMESAIVGFGGIVGMVNQDNDGTVAYFTKCANYGNIASAVTANDDSGGICGEIDANQENPVLCGVFQDCANYGIINAGGRPGGILGTPNATVTMKNCYNAGDIQSTSNYCGGIVGRLGHDDNEKKMEAGVKYECLLEDCVNDGDVIVFKSQGGGMVGYLDGDGANDFTFKNCVNNGDVYGADPSVTYKLGGIMGGGHKINKNTSFINCINNGNIGSDGWSVNLTCGGIAGSVEGNTIIFENCTNNGKITSNYRAGGMAGCIGSAAPTVTANATRIVTKCTNNGEIVSAKQAAGVAAYAYASWTYGPSVTYCVNTGNITGGTQVAGLIGYMNCGYENADIEYNVIAGEFKGQEATPVTDGAQVKHQVMYSFVDSNGVTRYFYTPGEDNSYDHKHGTISIVNDVVTWYPGEKCSDHTDASKHKITSEEMTFTKVVGGEAIAKNAIVAFEVAGVTYVAICPAETSGIVINEDDLSITAEGITVQGVAVPAGFDGKSIVLNTYDHPIATYAICWNNRASLDIDMTKNFVAEGSVDIAYIQGTSNLWTYVGDTPTTALVETSLADFANGTVAYELNEMIGETVFYQNIDSNLFVADAFPTTDATHAKVVMVGGVIGNQLFDMSNDSGSPATGDAIVYVVVALAVSTISLAAVAVCKKIKEN